uniref:FIST C-domain domain-containing protein n=2 Tax=Eukaryota TaxID=2759 RepID=A0A7S2Z440_9CHLO|mmetsp:Transcript_3663/g.9232  ORF Transcript_3663/g.9232 Transcript_3663/m.9232 type:complete len:109 (+) Transcript_3663:1-327(+)
MQQQQQQQKAPSSCFGGFLIICNARGSYLHSGLPDVETKVISKNLPNVPLIGFFANGEVGPMPFREWSLTKYFQAQEQNPDSQLFGKNPQFNNTVLQGNTSVLAIARI